MAMKQRSSIICVTTVLLLNWTAADAQVHAYRHHSTLEGDVLGALGEFAIGTGILIEKTANAEEAHVRALRERVAIQRQWIDNQYQLDLLDDTRRQRTLEASRAREDYSHHRTRIGAEQLIRDVAAGINVWSAMVLDGAYKDCVDQAVHILNRASVGYELADEADRLQLRRVAHAMKTLIHANHAGVSFSERTKALQHVRQLQYLASDQSTRDMLLSLR
jgi:hypothetical protein